MGTQLPEPSSSLADPAQLLVTYLDFYRSEAARKLADLSDDECRRSRLPSEWSPLELLSHLVHMERRWLVWGFAGEQVADPWGDGGPDGRWHVAAGSTVETLTAELMTGGVRTGRIVASARLSDFAAIGGRFSAEPTPTLGWILFHVLQEYARHLGHLDVARELADGVVGEDPAATRQLPRTSSGVASGSG